MAPVLADRGQFASQDVDGVDAPDSGPARLTPD